MKQADNPYHWPNPWMQESVSKHKNPTPQTFVHESGKVGGRGEEEERKDRGQEANGKKDSPTKQKLI